MPIPSLSKKFQTEQNWRHYADDGSRRRPKDPRSGSGWWQKLKRLWLWARQSRKNLIILGAGAGGVLVLFTLVSVAWMTRNLPTPDKLIERKIPQSTKIYDRKGETILYEVHGEQKRTLIQLKDVPEHVKWATITIEDKDFYKHGGFSLWAIFRTVVTNVLFGRKAGGSTLTQQFVKNAVLTTEKTYTRKIKELVMAYKLEKNFSKDEILQMYFNEIPYGSNAYGVEAASQKYFGKSVREVNLAEAAILAALPQAPSKYSPYGGNRELLVARQHYILDQMVKQGHTTEAKAEAAKQYKLNFRKNTDNITAPHFVMYVKSLLAEKYGEKDIEQGGYKIYTTLDLDKQKKAEEAVAGQADKNEKKYGAYNASLVSLDPKTGEILAMVGSRDYFNEAIDGQVNVALSSRQPGSSIKPIIYAAAFIKGYTPGTVLFDVVTNFSTDPAKPYEPKNYTGLEYGPVTMKKALAGSLNVPAVKTLYLTGIKNVIELTKNLGYTTLNDPDRYGLALVLGGGEVKLLEHANAFSAFAREGLINKPMAILKIEDKNGSTVEKFEPDPEKVLEPEIARQITGVLSDNSARAYIFGEKNYLTLGNRPVAAKTGTTNDNRDAWTIGYTPSIVTGVWVGNSDNTAMKKGADGSVVAAPIWNAYMKKILDGTPVETFNAPTEVKTGKAVLDGGADGNAGDIKIKIDRASGLLATEYTPASFIEEKIYKDAHCILYYVDKDDPRGDAPKSPADDPQFNLWESRVLEWANKQGWATSTPPTEKDNLHIPENLPTIEIDYPRDKENINQPDLKARVTASAARGVNRVEYYLDGNLLTVNSAAPFDLNKNISFVANGFHELTARACDDIDNCSGQTVTINLSLKTSATAGKIAVAWAEPTGGIALSGTQFPLALRVSLTNVSQVAKVNFSYRRESDKEFSLINSLSSIESGTVTTTWSRPPTTGNYFLRAEAYGWNGQLEKTNEISVVIN